MNEEQIKFITDKLGENNSLTEYFLKDFILDSEDILAVYDYYEQEKRENPRDYYFESIAYILTDRRMLVLEIKKDSCFLKVLNLDDIYGLEINRDNNIPGEITGLTRMDLLRTITIRFKNDDANNIKIEFKENPRYGIRIQKEKAFIFITALNTLLYSPKA